MSHTVIVDEDYRARQFENRLNAVTRHCRIGKVRQKVKWSDLLPGTRIPPLPFDAGVYNPPSDWFSSRPVVMDHPRNCPPFISAFTAARAS